MKLNKVIQYQVYQSYIYVQVAVVFPIVALGGKIKGYQVSIPWSKEVENDCSGIWYTTLDLKRLYF